VDFENLQLDFIHKFKMQSTSRYKTDFFSFTHSWKYVVGGGLYNDIGDLGSEKMW